MKTQMSFEKIHWKHRFSHGGVLRNERLGRGSRALSSKEPIHLVLKANKGCIRQGFRTYKRFFLIHEILKRYSYRFYIKVEQISVQNDHLHLLIRAGRRSNYQSFFRVFAGQISQQFEKEGLLTVEAVTDTPKTVTPLSNQSKKTRVTDTPKDRSQDREVEADRGFEVGPGNQTRTAGGRGASVGDASGDRGGAGLGAADVPRPEGSTPPKLKQKLWKYRPFTRVVRGWRAYQIVRDYIQLNEKEALREIPYQTKRLRGLSAGEWALLWG